MAFSNDPPNDYVFRDHTNLLKANGSTQEQTFIENLIVESIEIYGQDIYYLPRTYVNKDTIFQKSKIVTSLKRYKLERMSTM